MREALRGAAYRRPPSADEDLGEVLVDILVDRSSRSDRNITSLSLSEALRVSQKLTNTQFAALSCIFVFKQLKMLNVVNQHQFYGRLLEYLRPLGENIRAVTLSDVQYLAGLGCVTISIGSTSIPECFRREYPGLFSRSLDLAQNPVIKGLEGTPLITNNLRDPNSWQFNAVDEATLIRTLEGLGLAERKDEIVRVMKANLMTEEEILAEFQGVDAVVEPLVGAYNGSQLPNCLNTAIGTAIAHANLRRVTNGSFDSDVGIWIS
ncbi:LPO_1073/Vpar_1526 family protein [Streptomyces mexicanus]|uniref:LPO_1073/Vpar_1526 family protein n=1 Tax=Streptomyces mexicanus TaxID=178566 RepID=UPI0036750D38